VTVVDVSRPAGGSADIVYVLTVLQAAFVLLAAMGEMILMGANGAYLVFPVAKMVLLFWLATKIVSGRRWAMITMIVIQSITLAGFAAQLLAALVPSIGLTVNLAGLVTNLVMPIGVIVLCVRSMPPRTRPVGPVPTILAAPPQDPFFPAPIVDEATTVRNLARDDDFGRGASLPAPQLASGSWRMEQLG
jgi:hypothetical protein